MAFVGNLILLHSVLYWPWDTPQLLMRPRMDRGWIIVITLCARVSPSITTAIALLNDD
jgi:hypothetical protein